MYAQKPEPILSSRAIVPLPFLASMLPILALSIIVIHSFASLAFGALHWIRRKHHMVAEAHSLQPDSIPSSVMIDLEHETRLITSHADC